MCKQLRLEEVAKGEIVFNYGDQGQLFYIIIEGEVEIKVPSPVLLENDSATPEGLITFILLFFKDIYWKELPNCLQTIKLVYNELSLCHVSVDENGDFDSAKAIEAIDQRILKMQT